MAEVFTLRRAVAIRPDIEVDEVEAAPLAPVYPGTALSTERLAKLASHIVDEAFGVEALLVRGRKRGARRLAHARTVAMALVHLVCGRSQEDVASAFGGRNRTTASHHMELNEELNDCHEHEEFWDLLVQRYEALIAYDSLPRARPLWMAALQGLRLALKDGVLEGKAVQQARHVVETFWEEHARA